MVMFLKNYVCCEFFAKCIALRGRFYKYLCNPDYKINDSLVGRPTEYYAGDLGFESMTRNTYTHITSNDFSTV